ncbi:hypothetical protein GCM10011506_38260 [Marivirga lumbricoides]|uniref:DUF2231 domain-containing protein n=1 Tax=Marivirga lumbricoides TaxID=1046115 RepID=A0ABQ1N1A2_9BACT|nr:hypothetical protein GCM10011506_38260 [Marivirga lumbricoides]
MNKVPEFWRAEIWHPLSVHLPLAILLMATLFFLIGYFSKKGFWENMSKVLLLIGTAGAWLAIYTGNLADPVVSRQICDPTVLATHETNAYVVAWLFSAVAVLIILEYLGWLNQFRKIAHLCILILSLTGSGFLMYTGHLGATLVYQQAAGVYTPSESCSEFE